MGEITNAKSCKLKDFLKRQHTPFEKGLMIAGGVLAGALMGMVLAPASDGINIEISIGSHNGHDN